MTTDDHVGCTVRVIGIPSESYKEWNERALTLEAQAAFARNGIAYIHFRYMPSWFGYQNRVYVEFPELEVEDEIRETRAQYEDRIQKLKEDTSPGQDEWHQC